MNNSNYYTVLKKMQKEVAKNGVTTALVEDFKTLREYVVAEKQPLLAKVTRLAYQNIEEHNTFTVGIPDEEPMEDDDDEIIEVVKEETNVEVDPVESMNYLLALLNSDLTNTTNSQEVRSYVNTLKELAGEDY